MIAGCYDLHLYCDAPGCAHGQFGEQGNGAWHGRPAATPGSP